MARAIILIGGNEGDVEATLGAARVMLRERTGALVAASQQHRSAPWGNFNAPQHDFLNQALIIDTPLQPIELLDTTQQIEQELGRSRPKHNPAANTIRTYSSRPIDIDILFYDNLIMQTARLTIPHPLIAERRFVLEPLNEIAPDLCHPVSGVSVAEMLQRSREVHMPL